MKTADNTCEASCTVQQHCNDPDLVSSVHITSALKSHEWRNNYTSKQLSEVFFTDVIVR